MTTDAMTDATAVHEFLADRFGDHASGVAEIGRGAWAAAFGFTLDGEELVARFGALSDDFAKDAIAAEHASASLPIPRILEIGEACGGYYAISERAHGVYLDSLDEPQMRAALPSLFAIHDAMRLADVSRTSGYGGWDGSGNAPYATWQESLLTRPEDDPPGRIAGWRTRLAAYPVAQAAFDEGFACLQSLLPACPSDRHLVHSDPANRNILVANNQITAVLDWGCGMYGDFLYDLAHLTFLTCWFPAWRNIDFAEEAERHYAAVGLHVPNMRERLRAYEIHLGIDAIVYNAYLGRPQETLDLLIRRTLDAVRGG